MILEGHLGSVAPEGFEVVEVAFVRLEDVDNHAVVIEHDPLAGGKTVGVGGETQIVAQFFADFAADGFEVRVAGAGADDKKVREAGNFAQIENADIFGLFVGSRAGGGESDGFGVWYHALR